MFEPGWDLLGEDDQDEGSAWVFLDWVGEAEK